MALPALALIPALTWEGVAVASSIGGFFTYLWNKNYEEGKKFNFDFTSTQEFNSINTNYTDFETKLTTVPKTQIEQFEADVRLYEKSIPQTQNISTAVNDVASKTSLIDVIKTSNLEQIEQQKILNNNLSMLNNTILKLFEAKNIELVNQQKQNIILSENLKAINISLLSLASIPKIMADIAGSEISHSVENSLLIEKIEELTKTIKEKTTTVNASGGTFNLDTTAIVNAINGITENQTQINSKLVEGIQSQNKVNEKTLEKLNIELSKDISFEGKQINKAELDKIRNLEILKNVKDENDTDLNEDLSLLDDVLNDGFDLDYNPFKVILEALKDEFTQDSNDIKIKYNLK
jgi:hypothetical protein